MLTPKTTQPRPSPAFEEVSCQGFDLFCSLTRRQLPETVPVRKVYGLPRASFSRNLAVQALPLAMCLAPPPALRDFHPVEFALAERTRKRLCIFQCRAVRFGFEARYSSLNAFKRAWAIFTNKVLASGSTSSLKSNFGL